jgi:hypothetical protein
MSEDENIGVGVRGGRARTTRPPRHPPPGEPPPPAEWMSWTDSEKAWMSMRDADLLEALMVGHALALGRPIDLLEWGAGRSTLFYSTLLQTRGLLAGWIAMEHNREFFTAEIAPKFEQRPDRHFHLIDDGGEVEAERLGGQEAGSVSVAVFDGGDLRPYERSADRTADLDDYVRFPALLGRSFDLVVVDGRKRRRCLLEASRLLTSSGIVVLHDAWRPYYECALSEFSAGARIGDELWVGAQHELDLRAILPGHAFEAGEEE